MTKIKTQSTDRTIPLAKDSKGRFSKENRVEPTAKLRKSTELSFLGFQKEITKISEEFSDAERRGDLGFLEKNVSNNFVGISPVGLLLGKQDWLNLFRSFNVNYSKLDVQGKTVRIFRSPVAILTGKQSSSVKIGDHLEQGEFSVTEVFVNREGQWLLANRQLSRIQQ